MLLQYRFPLIGSSARLPFAQFYLQLKEIKWIECYLPPRQPQTSNCKSQIVSFIVNQFLNLVNGLYVPSGYHAFCEGEQGYLPRATVGPSQG